jgi:uncharacterized membrane protein YedE/YeeE
MTDTANPQTTAAASAASATAAAPVEAADVQPTGLPINLAGLFVGIIFGAVLAGMNLHEFDTIHEMLSLEDFRIYGFMGSAVAVAVPLLWWLERRGLVTPLGGRLLLRREMPQRHHVQGGVIFGLGWAIAGTCPAPALVMVSSGAVLGLVAMAGIFVGLRLKG